MEVSSSDLTGCQAGVFFDQANHVALIREPADHRNSGIGFPGIDDQIMRFFDFNDLSVFRNG